VDIAARHDVAGGNDPIMAGEGQDLVDGHAQQCWRTPASR
jgi:hypothetical protein